VKVANLKRCNYYALTPAVAASKSDVDLEHEDLEHVDLEHVDLERNV
jgi:uncharacterized protein YjbI with pentapeptide repeats